MTVTFRELAVPFSTADSNRLAKLAGHDFLSPTTSQYSPAWGRPE